MCCSIRSALQLLVFVQQTPRYGHVCSGELGCEPDERRLEDNDSVDKPIEADGVREECGSCLLQRVDVAHATVAPELARGDDQPVE